MDKQKVLEVYKETQSYAETARRFGVSNQRIHQIVTGYKSTATRGRLPFIFDIYYCNRCNNSRTEHIHHKDGNSENNQASNLMPVCIPCHFKEHVELRKLK